MARARSSLLYVGIKAHVIAFDRKTGQEVWRTALPAKYKTSGHFVNVFRDADGLFAACAGEIFALDPRSGNLLWRDPLTGLGTGLLTMASDLAGSSQSAVAGEHERQRQAAAAAAAV